MPTNKQRKLAELIVENATLDKPMNGGQMLAKVGYAEGLLKQPGRVIEAQGVQEALAEFGFTEENAKSVVAEILLDPDQDGNVRLNAAKEVFKVRGSYAAEKSVALNVNLGAQNIGNEELQALKEEYEAKLLSKLRGSQ